MKTLTKQATKQLLALTAGDLMTTPVMTIPQETSLREAASLLHGCHISGAPVVDAEGRCLGVLSSSDFVTWAGEGGDPLAKAESVTCFIAPWGELIDIENSPNDEIRRFMTAKLIAVTPSTPIGELAHQMAEAHIHRVLVVDQQRPCGIVTSTDILVAVAKAAPSVSQKHEGQ